MVPGSGASIEEPPQDGKQNLNVEQVIAIEIIADKIFSFLSCRSLLSCSLVNTRWNVVARKILNKYRHCTISITLQEEKQDDVLEKVNWLVSSPSQPVFNTLRIVFSGDCNVNCYSQKFQKLLTTLMSVTKFQNGIWKLEVEDVFDHQEDCPEFQVARLLCHMKSLAAGIQHLCLYILRFDKLVKTENEEFLFPNLKSICLNTTKLQQNAAFVSFVKDARKLEEVTGRVDISEVSFYLSVNKPFLIKNLGVNDLKPSDLDILLKLSSIRPKLKNICVFARYMPSLSKPAFCDVMNLLLSSSTTTLETLHINIPMLNALSQTDLHPVKRLNRLVIPFTDRNFSQLQHLLPVIPIQQLFPNLTSVEFWFDRLKFDIKLPPSFYDNHRLIEHTCPSVREFIFNKSNATVDVTSIIEVSTKLFPHVERFVWPGSVSAFEFLTLCLNLWTAWEGLQTLEIAVTLLDLIKSEACIFGISGEEWNCWVDVKEAGGVDLREMQYAPINYSIRNLPELRNFYISAQGKNTGNGKIRTLMEVKNVHKQGWLRINSPFMFLGEFE